MEPSDHKSMSSWKRSIPAIWLPQMHAPRTAGTTVEITEEKTEERWAKKQTESRPAENQEIRIYCSI